MFFDGALDAIRRNALPGFNASWLRMECKLPDMEKYKVYGNVAA